MRVTIALAVALSLWPASAQAFDDDGHFHMTYLAARLAGLSSEDALEVASAAVGVDASRASSPMPFEDLEAKMHPVDEVQRLKTVLPKLHSFTPPGGDETEILSNMQVLYDKATGNPENLDRLGVYLHFVGDYQAHQHDGKHITAVGGQGWCYTHDHGHAPASKQIEVGTLARAALTADPNAVGELAQQMGRAVTQMETESHWVDQLDSRPEVTQRLLKQMYFQIRRYAEQTGRTLSPPIDQQAAMALFSDLSTSIPANLDPRKEDFSKFLDAYLHTRGVSGIDVPERGDAISVLVTPDGETFRTNKTQRDLTSADVLPVPAGVRERRIGETAAVEQGLADGMLAGPPLSPEQRAQLEAIASVGNEKGVRIRYDVASLQRAISSAAIEAAAKLAPDPAADPIVASVAAASTLVVELEPPLVAFSLRRLVSESRGDRSGLAALSRITRVTGYVLDPSRQDIIVLATLGDASTFDVDDLVIAIRAVWRHGRTPLCSLDPKDARRLEAGFSTRVEGVPADSHFGRVMLDADYAMKRIHMNLDRDIPDGMKTVFDYGREQATIRSAEGDDQLHRLSRFWLTPIPLALGDVRTSSGGRLVLFASHVQNRTEIMLAADDGMVGTGQLDPADESGAQEFTQRYPELAARNVALARLQIVFDLTLMANLLRVHVASAPVLDEVADLGVREEPIDPDAYQVLRKEVPELVVVGGVDVTLADPEPAIDKLDDTRSVAANITAMLAQRSATEHSPRERLFLEAIDKFWAGQAALRKGDEAAGRESLVAAEELLGRTLAEDETFAPAYLLRAYIRIGAGTDAEGGIKDSQRVLALRPRTARAYALLGIAKLGSDLPEAMRLLGFALEANPRDPLARSTRGSVQMLTVVTSRPMFIFDFNGYVVRRAPLEDSDRDKLHTAYEDFSAALELDPSDDNARAQRAMTSMYLAELDAARSDARRLPSRMPEALGIRAQIELFGGDLDEAERLANMSIDSGGPGAVPAYVVRAAVHFTRQSFSSAYEDLTRAISLAPELGATMQPIADELRSRL